MNCRSNLVDLLLSFLGEEEFVIRFFDLDLEYRVSGRHYFGTGAVCLVFVDMNWRNIGWVFILHCTGYIQTI